MSRQRPVPLERRKNLLYQSHKRRSVFSIILIGLSALLIGIVIALLLKQSMTIEIGALPETGVPIPAGSAASPAVANRST